MRISAKKAASVRRKVLAFYRKHGRELWFREARSPYEIAVSEIMLQQTQVERVSEKYAAWLRRWPGWSHLAPASNREVLSMWSGLGYNRRALYLRDLAKTVMDRFGGKLPSDRGTLLRLPGIGPYTANALLVFAFGQRLAAVDTNVRKVVLHEFNLPASTPNSEIDEIAYQLLPRSDVREWHHALMDYARLALRSTPHRGLQNSGQSRYAGSLRQLRGVIIKRLTSREHVTITSLAKSTGRSRPDILRAARALERDGLVRVLKTRIRLA